MSSSSVKSSQKGSYVRTKLLAVLDQNFYVPGIVCIASVGLCAPAQTTVATSGPRFSLKIWTANFAIRKGSPVRAQTTVYRDFNKPIFSGTVQRGNKIRATQEMSKIHLLL